MHQASPHNRQSKAQQASILVIFGITGDLTKRLLYPAICNLGSSGLLNNDFYIIGIAREDYSQKVFQEYLKKNITEFITNPLSQTYALSLAKRVFYLSGDFTHEDIYISLKELISKFEKNSSPANYLFYLAVAPQYIKKIASELSKADLLKEKKDAFRRILCEKPFGLDYQSARQLNRDLLALMNEDQIYRIDHFLGKEMIQNLLIFRFANSIFESIWNHHYIHHIQITVAETLGVESRANYYEHVGALRDMVPNHIFQMLSLIAMEPPLSFSAKDIQSEKMKLMKAIKIYNEDQVFENVVRGQYTTGVINGEKVCGYRSEKNVSNKSLTETYVALKLLIDTARWANVPFYIRTGKRMPLRSTEIIIQFKSIMPTLFTHFEKQVAANLLKIFIQPDEKISIFFNSKMSSTTLQLGQVEMTFKYNDSFDMKHETGYEIILYECMSGNHLLFKSADMVELSWKIVQPILEVWENIPPKDFPNYTAGTWGPKEAKQLLLTDGMNWIL